MGDVEQVLVGVATLAIKQPRDMLASWSKTTPHTGSYSAKLYKSGAGNPGSTHVEIIPPTGITLQAWTDGVITNSFYCKNNAVSAYWEQFEFRFEDPNNGAWVEITAVMLPTPDTGAAVWEKLTLAADTPCGYYARTELDTDSSEWGTLINANQVLTTLTGLDSDACAPEDWILTRVRVELWEATPERTALIDSVEIMGTTYAIEPGGDAPGLSFGSPYTDAGYTEDGVTVNYTPTVVDVRVHEETYPVAAALSEEATEIVCNMAEASLANMNKAIAGAVLSGSILTIGAGAIKEMSIQLKGTTPAGYIRTYEFPRVVAVGSVGMSFKKDDKTIVPVTFRALKPASGPVGTFVDNVA